MPPRPPFWSSLFRNRRGNACCACIVLVLVWDVFIGTWSALCLQKRELLNVPLGLVAMLTLPCGLKGWRDHVDQPDPAAPVDTAAGA